MQEPDWTALLPPVCAIALAIVSRQVILSLMAGIWLGWWLLGSGTPLAALADAIEGAVAVLGSPGDARVIGFTLIIGAMIATMERTGGVSGFVRWLERRRWVDAPAKAEWLAWLTGIVVFIESNLTLLVAGSVSRPLFDRFRISRERLAYLIDSTSAPICILIPLNAWGAFNLGLLGGTGLEDPLGTFVKAIPLNLYAIFAVLLAAATIALRWNIGPMKQAEERTRGGRVLWPHAAPLVDPSLIDQKASGSATAGPAFMLAPIMVMVATVPLGLYVTGDGNLAAGSGSTSVLWAVLAGLATIWCMALVLQRRRLDELMSVSLRGAGGLLPVAVILLLALALGNVTAALGTGRFVAALVSDNVPLAVLPALIFLVSGFTAFAIGSSWGTFAIMIPIAIAIALGLSVEPAVLLGAVLAGAIFGDHASPISDTTVVASMAAATDHIDHVRTQLPYALLAGGVALAGYLVIGLML
ncbi:MAG: Na+/H+ antiporter NhaC family protein [Pseudomonadales bacterium]